MPTTGEKMKIVYIVYNIASMGGLERVLCNLCNYWVTYCDVSIQIYSLTTTKGQETFFEFDSRIQIIHCEYETPSAQIKDRIKLNFEIRNVLREIQNAFIITCVSDISIAVLLNKNRARNCKFIVTEHNEYDAATEKRHILERIVYPRADRVIALTKRDKIKYEKYLSNVIHIPNAVSFECETCTNYNKKVIAVGRLEIVKGFERLIEAFSLVSDKYPEWKLEIYGVGLEERKLKKLICDKLLQEKIELMGNEPDIKSKMLNASIHIVTSFHEGFSLVVLEAMECGLLNICMETTGTCETIENRKNGILVKQGDIKELAEIMDYYMSNPVELKKIGQYAKKDMDKYYVNNISKKWMELFAVIND